jgi:two-component system NtrC family sensor kinase
MGHRRFLPSGRQGPPAGRLPAILSAGVTSLRIWRPNLITKLTLVTSLILLLAMQGFAFFNLRTLRQLILEKSITEADNLSETLLRVTYHQMLEDDRPRVYQMIEEVGTQRGIELIRLINKDGEIIFSSQKKEIGNQLKKETDSACQMCHTDGKSLIHASSMNRSRLYVNGEGDEVLGMVKAVYNEESCWTASCHFHTADTHLLGILDITVCLADMRKALQHYRNDLLLETFILMFSLCLGLALLIKGMVHRPVAMLLRHTRALARGEWKRIESSPKDELGELSEAFNDMTDNLQKAREELEEWAGTLELRVAERTRSLEEAQSKLVRSEKLASLGELVAGIAHEINNPLTGILMYASILAQDSRLDPALRADLEIVIQETHRCSNIVRELLDFARSEPPTKIFESLQRVMEASLALVENQSYFHNIGIHRCYGLQVPEVAMDPRQMEQVFLNLLVNASQAMPNGGELTIRTGVDANKEMVLIAIGDTGCGIAPENFKKIFDPFFSTKGHEGTGLGLSVSYGIIESHGGEIDVESQVGEGTTFTIYLPMNSQKNVEESPPLKDPRMDERVARRLSQEGAP